MAAGRRAKRGVTREMRSKEHLSMSATMNNVAKGHCSSLTWTFRSPKSAD